MFIDEFIDKTLGRIYIVRDITGEAVHQSTSYEAAEFWIEEFASKHTPDRLHRPQEE